MGDRHARYSPIRPAQYHGALLMQMEAGQIRRAPQGLPSLQNPDHSYGRPTPAEDIGVANAMNKWVTHRPPPVPVPPRDYDAMNKKALLHGVHTPREARIYRQHNEMRVMPPEVKKQPRMSLPSDRDPAFIYGRQTSGIQSMDLLMSNHFQREWLESLTERNNAEEMRALAEAEYLRSINKTTKAAMGHHRLPTDLQNARPRSRRTSSVPSKMDSARSQPEPQRYRPSSRESSVRYM